jgi:hypothetical protein
VLATRINVQITQTCRENHSRVHVFESQFSFSFKLYTSAKKRFLKDKNCLRFTSQIHGSHSGFSSRCFLCVIFVGFLTPQITLTDNEVAIFSKLVDLKRYFDRKIVIRVAGGWVRDKVIAIDSTLSF